jgi:hypothetical protein
MSTADDNQNELQVCARILRALAHRIRGDLSVITNDLAYIATLVDPSETERARNRCSRISAGLSNIGAMSSSEAKKLLPIEYALRPFGVPGEIAKENRGVRILVADGLIEHAASLVRELVGEWESHIQIKSDAKEVDLILQLRHTPTTETEYVSVGAFAGAQLGERFAVEGGLVDLILRDHGWQVAVVCGDQRATVCITIPTVPG